MQFSLLLDISHRDAVLKSLNSFLYIMPLTQYINRFLCYILFSVFMNGFKIFYLIISELDHLFILLRVICISSSVSCLLISFAHFFIGWLVFFLLIRVYFLYIRELCFFSVVRFTNIFSHFGFFFFFDSMYCRFCDGEYFLCS